MEAQIKDDERRAAQSQGTAHLLPPLHGIPISVKDLVIFILRYLLYLYSLNKKAKCAQ